MWRAKYELINREGKCGKSYVLFFLFQPKYAITTLCRLIIRTRINSLGLENCGMKFVKLGWSGRFMSDRCVD